jgi:hypothetical protein
VIIDDPGDIVACRVQVTPDLKMPELKVRAQTVELESSLARATSDWLLVGNAGKVESEQSSNCSNREGRRHSLDDPECPCPCLTTIHPSIQVFLARSPCDRTAEAEQQQKDYRIRRTKRKQVRSGSDLPEPKTGGGFNRGLWLRCRHRWLGILDKLGDMRIRCDVAYLETFELTNPEVGRARSVH